MQSVMLFPGHVRWSLRVNEGAPHSSCLRCLPFKKKKKEKKCCGIFVSLFCFSLLFFFKRIHLRERGDDDGDITSQPESCESNVAVGSRPSALSALLQYFVTSY